MTAETTATSNKPTASPTSSSPTSSPLPPSLWTPVNDVWTEIAEIFSNSISHNVHARQKDPTLTIHDLFPDMDMTTNSSKPSPSSTKRKPSSSSKQSSKKKSGQETSTSSFSKVITTSSLTLHQDRSSLSSLGVTGTVAWDSAIILSRFLTRCNCLTIPNVQHPSTSLFSIQSKKCIELGAGTGLLSITLAMLGASRVVLTDQIETLKIARKNVAGCLDDGKGSSIVELVELPWGQDCSHVFGTQGSIGFRVGQDGCTGPWFDFILAADCVYNDSIVGIFVKTILDLARRSDDNRKELGTERTEIKDTENGNGNSIEPVPPPDRTKVLIAQELRAEEVHGLFVQEMLNAGFEIWRAPARWIADGGRGLEKVYQTDGTIDEHENDSDHDGVVVYLAWLKDSTVI
ncbi:hypothetical protein HDU76_005367 [Blyttiomyces sp. JEL0837]|nr:hypothetical protein HDU76_005367 [Blyttiomyces sp. JEL0837]